MRYRLTFAILIAIFGLTACESQAQSTITATPSQIVIATSTQLFAQTAEPIDTPTHTPPAPKPDETAEFPSCFGPFHSVRETSPDGQWIARVCERTNDDGSGLDDIFPPIDLQIRKKDGSQKWKVSFRDITGGDFVWYINKYGEHAPFISAPFPYHWYKDSRYLFVAPRVLIDGDRSSGLGLYRFDTQTGRLSPFLPTGESTYNFAFSPDDEYYVYHYGMEQKNIHIVSLENDKNQTFPLPGETGYVGNFIWSPDSSKFVFESYKRTTKKSALLLFDTTQQTFTSLIEVDDEYGYNLDLIEWVSNSQVKIWKEESQYLLNIETKELQPIATQPAP